MALSVNTVGTQISAAVRYPARPQAVPDWVLCEGRYEVRWARTWAELDEVMRLRFEVFNLELGEGLAESFRTGRDRDEFDATCHHLLVAERKTGRVVGTYRLRTGELARANGGFYSAGEFDMTRLPESFIDAAVEIGRACIAREHRNTKVLFLLWKGLVQYAAHNGKRYFFGCGSLPSQNATDGKFIYNLLCQQGYLHSSLFVTPQAGYECVPESHTPAGFSIKIPPLCQTYLRFGGHICGPPALDRQFKTIDYFVVFDLEKMNPKLRRMLFGA